MVFAVSEQIQTTPKPYSTVIHFNKFVSLK